MPESMSTERRNLLKALGAELVLTSSALGMSGAIQKADEFQKEISNSIVLQQFDNSSNPEIHMLTTAKEILNDTDGNIDVFVAAVGTGGTLSGTAKMLVPKEGLLVGISAGVNVYAIMQIASREEFKGKTLLTILCDTGERYLSTELFSEE